MKVGIDIHGVITDSPYHWKEVAQSFINLGYEVHIITGAEFDKVKDILDDFPFTHFFSITEYHKYSGKINYDKHGNPHLNDELWNRTKAEYCKRNNIDIHYDDSPIYGKYFTNKTKYIKV